MSRRFINRVVVFLLLGAIVNVAVAWGIGAFSPRPPYNADRNRMVDAQSFWSRYGPHDWPNEGQIGGARREGFGRTDYTGSATREEVVSGRRLSRSSYWIMEMRSGWPMRALAAQAILPEAPARQIYRVDGCIFLGTISDIDGYAYLRSLPLLPRWPGFAINTLFYAAVVWLLWAALFALRRRRRIKRGLCPSCAYPVGSNDVCTECGTPVGRALQQITNVRA